MPPCSRRAPAGSRRRNFLALSSRTWPRATSRRSAVWCRRGPPPLPAPTSIPRRRESGWKNCSRESRNWSRRSRHVRQVCPQPRCSRSSGASGWRPTRSRAAPREARRTKGRGGGPLNRKSATPRRSGCASGRFHPKSPVRSTNASSARAASSTTSASAPRSLMRRRQLWIVALALFGSHLVAQAPATDGPTLTPVWNITTDFAAPESAYYHAGSNSIFVSSINGQILEKDGNGYISRLAPDGKVVSAKWVTGLNAPKGIRSVGNTLWVADIDEVVSIDIGKAQITAHVKVDGAQFLNDLATASDGTVYVSDSNLSRIYAVKDGKSSIFVEGSDVVEQPNGLLVDGDRLILGTIGPAPQRGAGPPSGQPPAARGNAPPAA